MIRSLVINENTFVYKFGNPFNTGATILNLKDNLFKNDLKVKYFEHKILENKVILKSKLSKSASIYGLGQSLGSLNKKGRRYRLYSNDDPLHTPEKESLYGNHPFIIIEDSKNCYGVFIDSPSEMIFDIGWSDNDFLQIEIKNRNFSLYIMDYGDKMRIIKEYLSITGKPYIPPKWAFGYQQSRWSYPDKKSVQRIVEQFRKGDIPCDAIYLDIDYMRDYKIFTVDDKKFPDFKRFVYDMLKNGIKLVPIIDPGVKIEKDYFVYEEGVKNNYFCKDENNKDFIGAVWPGLTCFPDFLNSKTQKWWGEMYRNLTQYGINAFWNDMNEPAIFFTKKGLSSIKEEFEKIKDKEDIGFEIFSIKEKFNALSNNVEDYKSFYHILDNGERVNHNDVHNLYGYKMAEATAMGLKSLLPQKRYFLLSRSSYAGLHRFAAIWMGDNQSWWEHILVNIRMLQSLNICGFFYTGADIGGFGGNASYDLIIRWMQLGIFSPLFRNHSAIGTRDQEPWAFDKDTKEILRDIIRLRYALIPYIYSEYMRSVIELKPLILPLCFEFEDPICKNIEDQFMFGSSLMVAPIYIQNANGRFVHLPETKWLLWRLRKYENREMKLYEKGDYFINADLSESLVFIKENSLIVLTEPQNYVGEKIIRELTFIGFVSDKASFTYYDDDGESYDFENGDFATINIYVEKKNDDFQAFFDYKEGYCFKNYIKKINLELYDENGKLYKKVYTL
ncbi:MAG TPA: glycoside hydrolase family 31 protein [Spirochaetota bacterium]|nr:glycoside hydrolase family 31 protein [Spirochaetota bacterium]